jgi:thioredoxin 1
MTVPPEERRDSSSADDAALPAFSRLSEGTFHARLGAASGVSVVLFSAPHCGACRAWKRLLPKALAGVADALFEVDVSEATGVARYYGIFHLPAVYLYRDGRFHAELQCEARPESVRRAAHDLLAASAQDEP